MCENFLYGFKAGPAGGRLRLPSSAGSVARFPLTGAIHSRTVGSRDIWRKRGVVPMRAADPNRPNRLVHRLRQRCAALP
jgi:hypothetical protein